MSDRDGGRRKYSGSLGTPETQLVLCVCMNIAESQCEMEVDSREGVMLCACSCRGISVVLS